MSQVHIAKYKKARVLNVLLDLSALKEHKSQHYVGKDGLAQQAQQFVLHVQSDLFALKASIRLV